MFTSCTLCIPLLFFTVIKALSVCFGIEHCRISCLATSHIAFLQPKLVCFFGFENREGYSGLELLEEDWLCFLRECLSFTCRMQLWVCYLGDFRTSKNCISSFKCVANLHPDGCGKCIFQWKVHLLALCLTDKKQIKGRRSCQHVRVHGSCVRNVWMN